MQLWKAVFTVSTVRIVGAACGYYLNEEAVPDCYLFLVKEEIV
jgi:hypothetical protein